MAALFHRLVDMNTVRVSFNLKLGFEPPATLITFITCEILFLFIKIVLLFRRWCLKWADNIQTQPQRVVILRLTSFSLFSVLRSNKNFQWWRKVWITHNDQFLT